MLGVVATGAAWPINAFPDMASALAAFGASAVVPVGLMAVIGDGDADPFTSRTQDIASFAAAMGGPAAIASFLAPPGPAPVILAAVWLVAALFIALAGAARLLKRRVMPMHELCIDAGHLYLPVGAAWLMASRGKYELLGFREPIVTFTATHFHYAGFAAPVIIGLLGRELTLKKSRALGIYRVAAPVVIFAIPLVATGILFSRTIEMVAAVVLGCGMLAASFTLCVAGAMRLRAADAWRKVSGAMLMVAGASLVVSMAFAIAFTTTGSAGREATEPAIAFSTMVLVHGLANAIGFSFLGLIAFARRPPSA